MIISNMSFPIIRDNCNYEKDYIWKACNKKTKIEITQSYLVQKYLIQEFKNEEDVFNALVNYRLECIKNDFDENVCITQFFNRYELYNIYHLISLNKQTDKFKKWLKSSLLYSENNYKIYKK